MYSTFGSLNTSLQALQTMQQSIQTVNHNVSNANTPGYSRQRTVMVPAPPYTAPTNRRYTPFGQVGTGVVVEKMQRFRDSFLDSQIRNETLRRDGWEVRRDALQHAEIIWNEPSDTAVNSRLNAFWASWHNLATTTDSAAIRANVIETANDLSTTLTNTYNQFLDFQDDLDDQVARHVGTINDLAVRIADLNEEIRDVEGVGQQPNDLRDQRDRAITELSGYINVTVHESENGSAMVSLGGRLLVMDHVSFQLRAEPDPGNSQMNRVVWDDTGTAVEITGVPLEGGLNALAKERLGGKLGGLLIARDIILPQEMTRLDDIANEIVSEVNTLHQGGFGLDNSTGRDFFDAGTTGALNIAVDAAILADGNRIAAASAATGVPGDGSNALAIARLENATLMNGGTTTINEFYRAGIAELGQQTQQAILMTENQELLVESLENRQEAVAGVSLDEETTHLLQYQKTYQAAARVMTSLDEMLDTVINRMGLVGR